MKALSKFQSIYGVRTQVQQKMEQGTDYILKHRIYKHEHSEERLNDDMVKMFYPYPYRTNILEILGLLKQQNQLDDPRAKDAIGFIQSKRNRDYLFSAEKIFMQASWVPFDKIKKTGEWITNEVHLLEL
ncbi:hypothetical protein NIE88_16315 [Sporolactobacillus shoreicorticis]|uniref:Uncharacterized protein n=2 Tax=Sporolactobacillus shoreicorticis TaxID=1923877 RepID=A0ABW5S9N3_9BACL|nr:hypothetical protein [Sporolactobacillus shoreicorticis]MCO7127335.1 hypothetical protein [Sporolactobacillus shoreicorticis]